jgi:hypothetical protein
VAALLGITGVLAGSLHPLGLVLVATELTAYVAFAAALGTWVSLRAGDTPRAVAATLAWLLLASVGPALVLVALWSARPLALAGCAPVMLVLSLASPGELLGRPATSSLGGITDAMAASAWAGHGTEVWLACLASVAGYATAAWGLTRSAYRGFDVQLDRPTVAGAPCVGPTRGKRAPVTHSVLGTPAVE